MAGSSTLAIWCVNYRHQVTCRALRRFIADHQLLVIESMRHGGSLAVGLDIVVISVDGEPRRLFSGRAGDSFRLQPGEWASDLKRADAGSYVELLVPLPADRAQASSRSSSYDANGSPPL